MGISTLTLNKTIDSLEEALALYEEAFTNSIQQKAFRDAVIRRFRFSIELSLMVAVKSLGLNSTTAKMAVREMARNEIIADPQIWFDFIESRNQISHAYDEIIANQVLKVASGFAPHAYLLVKELESK